MIELVIARYKENLQWVNQVPKHVYITVYNKNPRLLDPNLQPAKDRYITKIEGLAMISPGHEAHTYLHHILNKYPNFAQTTYFLQGNPFDHTPDILNQLEHREGFDWLVDNWITCDYNGCPHHCNLPIGRVYEGVFNAPFPAEGLPFVPGAQFAVSDKLILSKPISYYEQIAEKMENEYAEWWHWCLERMWKKVFTGDHRR